MVALRERCGSGAKSRTPNSRSSGKKENTTNGLTPAVSPSRRRFLSGLSTTAGVALAGCSVPFYQSGIQIGEITIVNRDDTPHTVHLRIETATETVYETTRTIRPVSDSQPPATGEQALIGPEDGLPTAHGRYTIVATLDDGVDTIERTYPSPHRDGDCYSVIVRIWTDGTFRDMPVTSHWEGCV